MACRQSLSVQVGVDHGAVAQCAGCAAQSLWPAAVIRLRCVGRHRHQLTSPAVERPALLQKSVQPLKSRVPPAITGASRHAALLNRLLTSATLEPLGQIRLSAGRER